MRFAVKPSSTARRLAQLSPVGDGTFRKVPWQAIAVNPPSAGGRLPLRAFWSPSGDRTFRKVGPAVASQERRSYGGSSPGERGSKRFPAARPEIVGGACAASHALALRRISPNFIPKCTVARRRQLCEAFARHGRVNGDLSTDFIPKCTSDRQVGNCARRMSRLPVPGTPATSASH